MKSFDSHMYACYTGFIMLENLVARFQHPSILDLKMGTRTHGDDETDAKKAGKRRKAENSTTKELGVRLHGMQVSVMIYSYYCT